MASPTAVIVANKPNPLLALGIPQQAADKPNTAHAPLLDPTLVPRSFFLQGIRLVRDDAEAALGSYVDGAVATDDRIHLFMGKPPLSAKILKLAINSTDDAAHRADPEV